MSAHSSTSGSLANSSSRVSTQATAGSVTAAAVAVTAAAAATAHVSRMDLWLAVIADENRVGDGSRLLCRPGRVAQELLRCVRLLAAL